MFLLNSCHPLVCAPPHLREQRPPYPEVTEVNCRVPSASFSQAPWYALPVHLCRFRVRSDAGAISWNLSGSPTNPVRSNNYTRSVTTRWPTNINVVPIDYAFRPRLRDRLTLRRLTLRRNPWTFGDSVFHTVCRYSCQHSHFRYLQDASRLSLRRLMERSATARPCGRPKASARGLSPVTSSARKPLFRPVSCYAFFKGWLLLSQPPGCFGISTSFPT